MSDLNGVFLQFLLTKRKAIDKRKKNIPDNTQLYSPNIVALFDAMFNVGSIGCILAPFMSAITRPLE